MSRPRKIPTPRPSVDLPVGRLATAPIDIPARPAQNARRLALRYTTADTLALAMIGAETWAAELAALPGAGPLTWQAVQLHATHLTIIIGVECDA